MIRSFIAFELPPAVTEELARIQERLKKAGGGVKWVRPEGIHLTLNFLGNIHEEQVEPLRQVMAQSVAGSPPLELVLGPVGAFPSLRSPRVIWVGVEGQQQELARIKSRLDSLLDPLGFAPENRPFRPHLTLGRVKKAKNTAALRAALGETEVAQSIPFVVTRLVLYKSQLFPDGAQYTPLAAVGLA